MTQWETADKTSEKQSEVEENNNDTDNNKNYFDSKSMFYKNSIASSMKYESHYKIEINQNDSDKENTHLMKWQKIVKIIDKHYSLSSLSSKQSIIIISSYLVWAEEIMIQEEMRIQKCSSEDVWYSLSFCDHSDWSALMKNI